MKKVGIMSMQRVINYGSFLQAYGLKKLVESLCDSEVEYIDYKYEIDITNAEKRGFLSFVKRAWKNRNIYKLLEKKYYLKRRRQMLNSDLYNIGIAEKNYNKNIDLLLIGSDEVFNCLQPYPVGYSRNLFGKEYEHINVISYAASFGHTTYEQLFEYGIANEVGEMLSKFKSISVRDNNSYETVEQLLGKKVEMHIDPVLAYDFKNEIMKYKTELKNYIILYAYTGRLSRGEEAYIKKFARRINKKIISIGNYSAIADKNIVCNPLYIFSYFKNADYVITDTFHGTVFSIKMNAKFGTILRESNKNKLYSLLDKFGRTDRIIYELADIDKLYTRDIDYTVTNQVIKNECEKSSEYLKRNI